MIQIYDEAVAEKVITIPAKVERPSFRVIVPTPLTTVGDILEVTTTINGAARRIDPIKFVVESSPEAGMDIVAVINLHLCEQPSAPLPTIENQTKDQWVCKSPAERVAAKEIVAEELIVEELIKG